MSCDTAGYFVRVRVERPLCPRVTADGDIEMSITLAQAVHLELELNAAIAAHLKETESPST